MDPGQKDTSEILDCLVALELRGIVALLRETQKELGKENLLSKMQRVEQLS